MGIYDRDYMSDQQKGHGVASWSMITWLIVLNIIAFIIQHAVFNHSTGDAVSLSRGTLFSGQIWRLLSFQFCHAHPAHLLGNLLFLFFIGRMTERMIGSRHIFPIYLLGGLVGGLAQILLAAGMKIPFTVIGASASVLAIVIALIAYRPNLEVSPLLLPFHFKLKYLGWFLVGINVLGLLFTSPRKDELAYMAHLGGIAAGWVYVAMILPNLKPRYFGEGQRRSGKRRSKIAEAAESKKEKPEKDSVYLNKKVDAILEKISEEGMQSLTEEEKKILEKSSEKLSRKLKDK